MRTNSPPKILEWMLGTLQLPTDKNDMLGNYEELYNEIFLKSRTRANLWYVKQILFSIPVFFFDNIYWGAIMFFNFLKVSARQLTRSKLYSFINISSLVIGITAFMLMLLWVGNELSYDRYVKNGNDIYRVLLHDEGERHLIYFAGILDYLRAQDERIDISGYGKNTYQSIRYNNKHTFLKEISYADPVFLDYLEIDLSIGDRKSVLDNPYSIIISESAAEKLFGYDNPVDEKLVVNNEFTFTISGVFKDLPATSHLSFDLLTSMETLKKMFPKRFEQSGMSTVNFYTRVKTDEQKNLLQKSLLNWYVEQKKLEPDFDKDKYYVELQPLYDIHLYSNDLVWDMADRIDVDYVYGSIVIAILILLLACFNYINLSLAKNLTRSKEIGIRKIIGSNGKQLFLQFLGESFLFVFISFLLSLLMIAYILPGFNNLTGKGFTLLSFITSGNLLIIGSVLGSIILILALLPIRLFSKTNIVSFFTEKSYGSFGYSKKRIIFGTKHILVALQFIVTVLICSLFQVVNNQIEFMMNKNPGYNADNVLILDNPWDENVYKRYETFSKAAEEIPGVKMVTCSGNIPGENIWNYCKPHVTGKPETESQSVGIVFIQYKFFEVLDSKIISGRKFYPSENGDDISSVILNKSAAKLFGIEEAGTASLSGIWSFQGPQKVVGIVEDLYTKSLYEKVMPTIYMQLNWSGTNILLKVDGNNIHDTMEKIKTTWAETVPDWPISYRFLDDYVNNLFTKENTILSLLKIFSLIAVLISAMGIFGLISFTVIRKTKEIGIRKVLGASVGRITLNILSEFLLLILLANIIAWPLAYYLSELWLQNFAYTISINLFVFAFAGILALIIALFSGGIKTYLAANLSPVDAIKYE